MSREPGKGKKFLKKSLRAKLPRNGDQNCFICLEDDSVDDLVSCCTQCYTCCHLVCWNEWKKNHQIADLRSAFLGSQRRDDTQCTICRTGVSVLGGSQHQNFLLSIKNIHNHQILLQQKIIQTLMKFANVTNDSEEQVELSFFSPRLGTINIAVILLVVVVDFFLISFFKFYAPDVIAISFFFLYLVVFAETCLLAFLIRNDSMKDVLHENLDLEYNQFQTQKDNTEHQVIIPVDEDNSSLHVTLLN